MRPRAPALLAACALLLLCSLPTGAQAKPGEALIADSGGLGPGTLYRIDAGSSTGAPLVPLVAGAPLVDPIGVAVEASGTALVADTNAGPGGTGAVFRVNLATGAIATLASGPPLFDPIHLTVAASGQIYVADQSEKAGSSGTGSVHRINPSSGAITTIATGSPLRNPGGIAITPDDRLFVGDTGDISLTPEANGKVLSVNPVTGAVTTANANPNLIDPVGLELRPPSVFLYPSGLLYGADFGGDGQVFSLDLARGFGLDFTNAGGGLGDSVDIALEPRGSLLVADFGTPGSGTGAVYRVNLSTKNASGFISGPPLIDPSGVAVLPPMCAGRNATIVGTEGRAFEGGDKLTGSAFDDVIVGLGERDRIDGGPGNDLICGGPQKDKITGGLGNDRILGDKGNDKLVGGLGADVLIGKKGKRDRCIGGKGRDRGKGCERGKL
jgi:hypothetical protein